MVSPGFDAVSLRTSMSQSPLAYPQPAFANLTILATDEQPLESPHPRCQSSDTRYLDNVARPQTFRLSRLHHHDFQHFGSGAKTWLEDVHVQVPITFGFSGPLIAWKFLRYFALFRSGWSAPNGTSTLE